MLLTVSLLSTLLAPAAPAATGLAARYRDGQVFITWQEPAGSADLRFRVLGAATPITAETLAAAEVLADDLAPGSATDWWFNPETFGKPVAPGPDGQKPPWPRQGWLLDEGGTRLDPDSGLLVQTITPATAGPRYYAVVTTTNATVSPGVNSLREPVVGEVAPPRPIWQGEPADRPARGAGQGLPLDLTLHAKTGRGPLEWLAFGDGSLGWRDGLPFKFGANRRGEAISVVPTDRTWIDRMFPEGKDGCQKLTPAIHSFWFGYNNQIHTPERMAEGVVVPYTEHRVLWILDWVKDWFGTDPNRTYCMGSSMGGCGTISFALRHPEIFAAIAAQVPIVRYAAGEGGDSTFRVVAETGGMDQRLVSGETVAERLDGTGFVRSHPGDLPYLVIGNGRQDTSIPWWQNPGFYRAMGAGRHGFVAHWNEGRHDTYGKLRTPEAQQHETFAYLHRFALNQSYLAFSGSTLDNNPGNGDAADGDPAGQINHGLESTVTVDEPGRYEATVTAAQRPVTVDLTPRRVQQFTVRPGERLRVEVGGTPREVTVTPDGLIPIDGVTIAGAEGVRVAITRGE